jgi:hypothetical protein
LAVCFKEARDPNRVELRSRNALRALHQEPCFPPAHRHPLECVRPAKDTAPQRARCLTFSPGDPASSPQPEPKAAHASLALDHSGNSTLFQVAV